MTKHIAPKAFYLLVALSLLFAASVPAVAGPYYLIDVIGDDMSLGTYPDKVKQMLASSTAYNYTFDLVARLNTNGTTEQILASMQNDAWLNDNPSCVIIMAGGNDIRKSLFSGTDANQAASDAAAGVQEIVDYVTSNTPSGRPVIIVVTLPPSMDASLTQRIDKFNSKLRTGLYGVDAIVLNTWEDLYDSATGLGHPRYFKDEFYPNVAGNWKIARNIHYQILYQLNPELMNDAFYH